MASAIDHYYFLEGLNLVRLTPFSYKANSFDDEIFLEGSYVEPTRLLDYFLSACTISTNKKARRPDR